MGEECLQHHSGGLLVSNVSGVAGPKYVLDLDLAAVGVRLKPNITSLHVTDTPRAQAVEHSECRCRT